MLTPDDRAGEGCYNNKALIGRLLPSQAAVGHVFLHKRFMR